MEFTATHDAEIMTISMAGRLTFSNSQEFKRLTALLDNTPVKTLVIDLANVEFIDSAGIGMLLLLRDRCINQSTSIQLKGATGHVAKIIALSRFDRLFSQAS